MPNEITVNKSKLCLEGRVIESKYFFFDTDPKKKHELAIVFGGVEKCASDFEIKRRTYPYYVIEIPIKGLCALEIGDKTHRLAPNYIGGFAPEVAHHYKCDKNNPMEHVFIAFFGTQAKNLFEKAGLYKGNVLKMKKTGDILYLAESILKKAFEKSVHSHELCCSYLKTLLLEQSADISPATDSLCASMNTYKRCRKYIDENFSTLFLPSQVAQKCSVNVRYMSRLFKQYADVTPHEYIMRLKLNKAANLLLTTNLSIKNIAQTAGFADPYHFSRNFKNFHGVSPNHYRNPTSRGK
ncbi:MAG: AraC family transcriptional regulator [Planctomycetaceae bacterium]|nr:AraC family transcriptional regulator [Planctomycetaceae bacterium]